MRHAPLAALLAVALVAGCGMGARVIAPVAGMVTGAAPRAAAKMPDSGPQITVTLSFLGVAYEMRELDRDGSVITWMAQDGSQIETREGLVTATRGLGMDLMSARIPSLAELTGGAPTHSRVDFFLDGTDTMLRRDYACTVSPGDGGDGPAGSRHLVEKCESDAGYISNQYWIGKDGKILKSSQWVSSGAGYAGFVAP